MDKKLYALKGRPADDAKRRDKKPFVRLFFAANDEAALVHARTHHANDQWILAQVREDLDLLMQDFPSGDWRDMHHHLDCSLMDKHARIVPANLPRPELSESMAALLVIIGTAEDLVCHT